MAITVDGVSLQDYGWNIRTVGARLVSAAPRGGNTEVAGADGALWAANKPLGELQFELDMWVVGAEPDGSMPHESTPRALVRQRVDELLGLLWRTDRLVEIVDTDRGRRCFAEVTQPFTPTTMAGATRAEFAVECNVPAGCWEDTDTVSTGPVALTSGGTVTLDGLGGGNLPPGGLTVALTAPGRNVRLTTTDGSVLEFRGDLPTSGVFIDTTAGLAYPSDNPTVSLMKQVRWWPHPPMLPLPPGPSDPAVEVTAEATTVASRIEITGRRRWRTA